MSIVRDVYEGLTVLIYYLVINVGILILFYIGPINLLYALIQLILLSLWLIMGFYAFDRICVVNKLSCRFVGLFRFMIVLVPMLYIFSLFTSLFYKDLGLLLYLVTESICLAVSLVGFIGIYSLSRQFRKIVGIVGSLIAIIGVVFWLPLIQILTIIGIALVAVGVTISIVITLSIRQKYSPHR